MPKEKKSVQEIVQKSHPEFASEVDGMSIAELESRLANYAKEQEKIVEARAESEALKDAKARVAEITGPFNDAKKAINLKMKYLIALITEKGGE